MMELSSCAFIVILVSLVNATPYGYGVKGGASASARADSNASAGAFGQPGDIPVAAPFGNGFSGSFSKSSSSSSSSSSASSSSSSTSFSYNGSGAGSLTSPGSNGNVGCTSGICQNSGVNEISGNQGSIGATTGLQGYNTANAANVAEFGCKGSTCDNNSGKCSPGQCQQTGTPLTGHDSNNKCTSGQCEILLQTNPSVSLYDDSDDIHFVGHSSKSAHNSKHQPSSYDKTTGYTAGSDCIGGNCELSMTYNLQPHAPVYVSKNSYHHNLQPSDSNPSSTPNYPAPAIHLETPKEDLNCNYEGCNSRDSKPDHGNSPSSYNIPIHSTDDSSQPKPSCDNGKCDNPQRGSYSSTASNSVSTNYLGPQDLYSTKNPFLNKPNLNCAGPNCGSITASQTEKSTISGSTDLHPGLPISIGAIPSSCSSANCEVQYSAGAPTKPNVEPEQPKPSPDKLPVYTDGFGAPAGILKPNVHDVSTTEPGSVSSMFGIPVSSPGNTQSNYDHNKPSDSVTRPGEKLPIYTGGFGGPAGMLTPINFNIPTSPSTPAHTTTPIYTTPLSITGCKTPNCIGTSPVTTPQTGSYGIHKESDQSPNYVGGFGGPVGMLKPNDFDVKVSTKPVHSPVPSYNNHPSTSSPATACKTSNCNDYTTAVSATAIANTQSGSYGDTIKPNAAVDSSSELPPYTGGFGGPAGLLKPNEFNIPHTAPNSHSPGYSGVSPNKTPGSNNNPSCTSPNCYSSSIDATNPQTSVGINTPSNIPNPSSITFPGYTSNYRPIGITNPSAPAVAPISPDYTNTHSFYPSGTYSPECKTGNCAVNPTGGADVNGPYGTYDNSAGCKTGNCASYPTGGLVNNEPSALNSHSGGCKTGNCVTYPSSGPNFDGPSTVNGNLAGCKTGNCATYPTSGPNTNGPSTINGNTAGCKTGNCATYPTGGPNINGPTTVNGNTAACNTGNCPTYPTGGPNTNSPSIANGNTAGCKTGNCATYPIGGPNTPSTVNDNNAGCKTGNCATYPTGGPNTNGPSTVNSPGCKTGNCATYPTGGPNTNGPSTVNDDTAGCKTGNCPTYPAGGYNVNVPTGPYNGIQACKTGNCAAYPNSDVNVSSTVGSYGITKPDIAAQPSNPQYNHDFKEPSGISTPTDHSYHVPSGSSGLSTEANVQSGSKQQLPAYTGGFGAPYGLLKPNDNSNPTISSPPNKPSTSLTPPVPCSSGNCNYNVPSPSSPGYNSASSGAHTSASSSASASANVYLGGFGGPPGFLKPYDDGKADLTKTVNAPNQGSHYGSSNINFPDDTKPIKPSSGNPLNEGALSQTGTQSGTAMGAIAYSGSVTSGNSGSYGYNTHGTHAGNGGNLCPGGCGGGGYQDGTGSGSSAAAASKSQASSGAYGAGGSFSGSSASAHSSAGSYTKGGYGKR